MGMADRKEQIFAKNKKVAGKLRPASKPVAPQLNLKKVLDEQKCTLGDTILKTCSFKSGDNIHTIENPRIQSINKNKKHLCFLVSGNEVISNQADILKKIPKGVGDDLEKMMANAVET